MLPEIKANLAQHHRPRPQPGLLLLAALEEVVVERREHLTSRSILLFHLLMISR
jgi:hypothetical protein